MTRGVALRLAGPTKLDAALARVARRHDVPLVREQGGHDPVLTCWRGGVRTSLVPVDDDTALPAAVVDHAVRRAAAALAVAASHVSVVVLAPAAGVRGPAAAGPVDAVRDEGAWTTDADGTTVSVRLLATQQTRCWLANCTFLGVPSWSGAVPGGDVEVLPDVVAADTAKVCEFMADRGLGEDWPQIALLGAPGTGAGGELSALLAFTEGGYAQELVGAALGGEGT